MKWKSDWWGITVIADTKDDIKTLRYFLSKLDSEAIESYEEGKIHIEDKDGVLELVFNR